MKKLLLSFVFLLSLTTSLFATSYYTVDVGNGGEWSLDGVTPCNCQPIAPGNNDLLVVTHDINLSLSQFNGNIRVDSNSLTMNGALSMHQAEVIVRGPGSVNFTGSWSVSKSTFILMGNVVVSGTLSISNSLVYGGGSIDLTNATVSSYLTSVNGETVGASVTGTVIDLAAFNLNIWNGSNWSRGRPPFSCNEYALIQGNYSTNRGNITAGVLLVPSGYRVTVETGDYLDVCDILSNTGNIRVKNKGSIVQGDNCRLIDNGGFIIERQGQHKDFKYNIWSSPVLPNEHLETIFQQTNPCDMYVFDSENQEWKYDFASGYQTSCNGNPVTFPSSVVIPGGDGLMNPGRGYFIPGPTSWFGFTREFRGSINNGDITIQVSTTSNGDTDFWYGDDWNMIGNPYPSSLDCQLFWDENADKHGVLTDGMYLWVEDAGPPYDQFANYLVWNPIGATYIKKPDGGGGITSSQPFDGVIPSCSGFWITTVGNHGGGNGGGNANAVRDIKFDNSMRLKEGLDLIPNTSSYSVKLGTIERAWFTLTTDSNNYDQILIGHHPRATDTLDLLYDARFNPGGNPILLATIMDSVPYTIQGLAPTPEGGTFTMELFVGTSDSSQHYLTLDSTQNYLENRQVFLIDSVLNTRKQFTEGVPMPLPLDSTGEFAERFYLEIITTAVSVEEGVVPEFDGRVWVNDNTLYFDNFEVNVAQMAVFSMSGQQLFFKQVNSRNSSFPVHNLEAGIYLVKCISQNGETITKRIMIQ